MSPRGPGKERGGPMLLLGPKESPVQCQWLPTWVKRQGEAKEADEVEIWFGVEAGPMGDEMMPMLESV